MRTLVAVLGLGQAAAMGPGTMPAPAYDASSNGAAPLLRLPLLRLRLLRLLRLRQLEAQPAAPLFAPVPQGVARAGGFFGKERHIPPAAGKQPHITFILMDD